MTNPDLVTRLRQEAKHADGQPFPFRIDPRLPALLREAADALEQVTKMKDAYKVAAERQYDEVEALTAALTVSETERTMCRLRHAREGRPTSSRPSQEPWVGE